MAVRSPPRRQHLLRHVRAACRRCPMKRVFDIALSAVGLVAAAPVWAVCALAVKLQDGGPVMFRQARVGRDGRIFDALKFRSMIPDAEARTGAVQATEDDPR